MSAPAPCIGVFCATRSAAWRACGDLLIKFGIGRHRPSSVRAPPCARATATMSSMNLWIDGKRWK